MLLQRGRNSDAIAILEFNVEEYPKSTAAYDSLGEAYAQDGQKAAAAGLIGGIRLQDLRLIDAAIRALH